MSWLLTSAPTVETRWQEVQADSEVNAYDLAGWAYFIGLLRNARVSDFNHPELADMIKVCQHARETVLPAHVRTTLERLLHEWVEKTKKGDSDTEKYIKRNFKMIRAAHPALESIVLEIKKHIAHVESICSVFGLKVEHDHDKLRFPRVVAQMLQFCTFEESKEEFPELPKSLREPDCLASVITQCQEEECVHCTFSTAFHEVIQKCPTCKIYMVCHRHIKHFMTMSMEQISKNHPSPLHMKLYLDTVKDFEEKTLSFVPAEETQEFKTMKARLRQLEEQQRENEAIIESLKAASMSAEDRDVLHDCISIGVHAVSSLDKLGSIFEKVDMDRFNRMLETFDHKSTDHFSSSKEILNRWITAYLKDIIPSLVPEEWEGLLPAIKKILEKPGDILLYVGWYIAYVNTENRTLKNLLLMYTLYKLGLLKYMGEKLVEFVDWIMTSEEEVDKGKSGTDDPTAIPHSTWWEKLKSKLPSKNDLSGMLSWLFEYLTRPTVAGQL